MLVKQRTTEWIEQVSTDYHKRQLKEVYRSTVFFCDWLEKIGYIHKESAIRVIDFCSGPGANIAYMGRRYPKSTFVGVDLHPDLVAEGNDYFQDNNIENCRLEVADIYSLDTEFVSAFDGIISFQTLSWLPGFKEPFEAMKKLNPQWFALTSLFYEGQVTTNIETMEYDEAFESHRASYYNVYSLPLVERFLNRIGFSDFQYTDFEIDIDLPKPARNIMGSYTQKLQNGHRLQVSGPLLMPWYFIAAKNKDY